MFSLNCSVLTHNDYSRYVAEVSASAVAVEQLDRQGRLNLQPAVAQASQEWAQDEVEEEEEAGVGANNQDDEEEINSEAGGDSPVGVITRNSSCDERNVSSQSVRDHFENKVESSCDTLNSHEKLLGPGPEQDSSEEADKVEDEAELSTLDIEDMRENLVLASEEAQQLLSDLNNR